jgi:hypothetical protein
MSASLKFGDVVALLDDVPEKALASGQVGTVVELLDGASFLIEFSDNQGRAYAIAPFLSSQLLVLQGIY